MKSELLLNFLYHNNMNKDNQKEIFFEVFSKGLEDKQQDSIEDN